MHSERKFCKIQRILLQMDPKAVSIYYDFVLLPHKQKEQNKLIRLNRLLLSGCLSAKESFRICRELFEF